jgi:hypothetical protein
MAGGSEVAMYLQHANLLHLASRLLRRTVLDQFIETRGEIDGEFVRAFHSIFGFDPMRWIAEREMLSLTPERGGELLKILQLVVKERPPSGFAIGLSRREFPEEVVVKGVDLLRLQELGWSIDYSPQRENFDIRRHFGPMGVTFSYELVVNGGGRRPRGFPKGGVELRLYSIELVKSFTLEQDDPRLLRTVAHIRQDMLLSRS